MANKKNIIELLELGESCEFETGLGDDSLFVVSKNAVIGKEEDSWYEITFLYNYDPETNSAENIMNINECPNTAEKVMEVMEYPQDFQWRDCGGALVNF